MKRFIPLLLSLILSFTALAEGFAGKTYRCTRTENGRTATSVIKFTSNTSGINTNSASDTKPQSIRFNYERSGDILNCYSKGSLFGFIDIDTCQEYGEDALYMTDDYGNVVYVWHRVADQPKTSKSGKTTRKRSR